MSRNSERGAVLVTVLFFMPVLLLLLVFVVDVGNWWTHKRHLQSQVDAAAIAAGDLFGECFSNNGGAAPTAYPDMQNAATRYSGASVNKATDGSGALGPPIAIPSPQYNKLSDTGSQGTVPASVTAYYNSKSYPTGGTADTDTVNGDSCAQTSQTFDVKASEASLPLFFNSIVAGFSVVPAVNAHARVQLFQAGVIKGSLPLAVPDTAPSHVFVTLYNMSTPTPTKIGDYDLPGPPTSSGAPSYLNLWTGTFTPTMPTGNSEIGIRVGLGNTGASGGATCFQSSGVNGSYECYENQATSTPLVIIRGYNTGGSPTYNAPILRSASETATCSTQNVATSPFFSDVNTGPCTATVNATVDWGTGCPSGNTPCTYKVTATDGNGNSTSQTKTSGGVQSYTLGSSTGPFTYPMADGQERLTLTWSYTITNKPPNNKCGGSGNPPCSGSGSFLPATPSYQQQAYSADSDLDVSGPVKLVTVSPDYSFAGGSSPTLTVTVGLPTNLSSQPVPSPTTILRVYASGTNRTSVINCDAGQHGGGNNDVKTAFESGCTTPYQINSTQSCNPDPMPPGNADCVPVKQGNLGSTVMTALDKRFGAPSNCPANNWPGPFPTDPPDPRIVQLMVTDTSALLGSQGSGKVPVTNFAAFYVTGWAQFTGNKWMQDCSTPPNDQVPAGLSAKSGAVAIWGHYIKFVPVGDTPGKKLCTDQSNTVIPCVPALVR